MRCCLFFRAEILDGIEVRFGLEERRIAPLKLLSIPRLGIQSSSYSVRLRKIQ